MHLEACRCRQSQGWMTQRGIENALGCASVCEILIVRHSTPTRGAVMLLGNCKTKMTLRSTSKFTISHRATFQMCPRSRPTKMQSHSRPCAYLPISAVCCEDSPCVCCSLSMPMAASQISSAGELQLKSWIRSVRLLRLGHNPCLIC